MLTQALKWLPVRHIAQSQLKGCRFQHRLYSSMQDIAPKAAIMVIGDEILSGQVVDTNTPWLAKLLYSQGVDLIRVEYVPDDKEDISESVKKLRTRVGESGFVFTSGGIGPTHDDVTYEAIANAFGVELQLHTPTVERMKPYYEKRDMELNEARLRMATLPKGAEVLFTEDMWVPLVNINSVYILPGVPRIFTAIMKSHKDRFRGPQSADDTLYTKVGEGDLAQKLGEIAQEFPTVSIGSYPNTNPQDDRFLVQVKFTSRDQEALQNAVQKAKEGLSFFRISQ
eukprot:TRINITY_DN15602_c0_g1_i3.p2 TRINITY_DN15602_c0_g1~~TRINITY_DN15602_c0_g1_i3.p2  ORF type:complete len:290 (-),score=29.25 TRINITY_DN15602_c0_g1_i3:173-1021(-)